MEIAEAVQALDPKNDDHWTAEGLPRMDAVEKLFGDDQITRQQVSDAVPGFTRETALAKASPPPVEDPDDEEDEDEDDEDEKEIGVLEKEVAGIDQSIAEMKAAKDEAVARLDALLIKTRKGVQFSDPNAVQNFLKSQQRALEIHAKNRRKNLSADSQLDRALSARRPARGSQRPNIPPNIPPKGN